jgi:hypothetical protein
MNISDRLVGSRSRECVEQFSILLPGEKCESKKALPSVVDCYFHHRMNVPCSVALKVGSPV